MELSDKSIQGSNNFKFETPDQEFLRACLKNMVVGATLVVALRFDVVHANNSRATTRVAPTKTIGCPRKMYFCTSIFNF